MPPRPVSQNSFIRGLVAVTNVLRQPKGSVPRLSNLIFTRRDSLATCDGSLLLHEFNGAYQTARGPILAAFLFQPPAVTPYYLILARCPDQQLGQVKNVTATLASGGSLTVSQQYFYLITALDGIGGETIASAEVSATPTSGNQSIKLQWQGIPNAAYYNVYRGTTTGGELLLLGTGLPVPQPAYPPAALATFTDTGAATGATYNISSWVTFSFLNSSNHTYYTQVTVTTSTNIPLAVGQSVYVSTGLASINGTYQVTSVLASNKFMYEISGLNIPVTSGNTGTVTPGQGAGGTPPVSDTTQQSCLFKCPAIQGANPSLPISYDNTMIVARYPADTSLIPDSGAFVAQSGGQGTGGTGGGSGGSGGILRP